MSGLNLRLEAYNQFKFKERGAFMSTQSFKLLKCPSCGGPIEPPGNESSTKCPYCGVSVIIPESLRKTETQNSQSQGHLFGTPDLNSMLGYGAQWSQVVQLAQAGKKEDAVQKYMSFSSISEMDARRTVEGLANSQVYDVSTYTANIANAYAPMVQSYTDTAKKITAWSLGFSCLVTGFIMVVVLVVVGISLWAAFAAF
jgi:predicted RNA-binding Zn-ribbon protein involved in translation (DUF1610 family)